MTEWIAWTRCRSCEHTEKDIFHKPDDAAPFDATSHVRCPKCGQPARYITFPAFDIQTIELTPPGDAMYETMDDW